MLSKPAKNPPNSPHQPQTENPDPMNASIETSKTAKAEIAGKYLTFALGAESYGIAVLKIREIIRMCEITPVPEMPAHVRGVLNLRGKIIPVIDLRRRFGLAGEGDDVADGVGHIVDPPRDADRWVGNRLGRVHRSAGRVTGQRCREAPAGRWLPLRPR